MPRHDSTPLPQPIFDEAQTTPAPTAFKTPHDRKLDNQLYAEIKKLQTKDVVSFKQMRGSPDDVYTLEAALGGKGVAAYTEINKARQIVFHAAGDTGASTDTKGKFRNEITVADQMAGDCQSVKLAERPRFFYHLGDIVYNFCESRYWYDQFYEPYRNYPAPIFAIPGNHDSFVIPGTKPEDYPLETFTRNFCATVPTITAEAGSLHRTAMTQPGVYFTLDAPFVRIIGLFSNALEDPGVISDKSVFGTEVPPFQTEYLKRQLERIKEEQYAGAVILAVHHPPFSYAPEKAGGKGGGNHGSSIEMLTEVDRICDAVGVYPHAFLSGHAHNYQRFMRAIRFGSQQYEVPFVVCGDGGHNVNPIVHNVKGQHIPEPQFDSDVSYLEVKPVFKGPAKKRLTLKKYADSKTSYGYLRLIADKQALRIGFHTVGLNSPPQSRFDMVTVDLATHRAHAN
jgi:hypothetical protein